MTDRYTRKDAENALARLAGALGHPVGHYRPLQEGEVSTYGSSTYTTIPGGWDIDWNPAYGGIVIQEIDGDGGTSIREPFGSMRRTYRDFCDTVNFALNALSEQRIRETFRV